MRLMNIIALSALSTSGFSVGLQAAMPSNAEPIDKQLQLALESEFLFQSGQFSAAFDYYRNRPLVDLSSQELLRSIQIARVLGDAQWLQHAASVPESAAKEDIESKVRRFEMSVQNKRYPQAAKLWRDLNRTGPDDAGLLAARESIALLISNNRNALESTLSEYADLQDLDSNEVFELFEYAYQWQMDETADELKSGLKPGSWQASMAELIVDCIDGKADACVANLKTLSPDDLDDVQRRSVLAIAQGTGDSIQIQRWLKYLTQDSATFYQRIVGLSGNPNPAEAELLKTEIEANPVLSQHQRAALLGSLAEIRKDWPSAESNYRDVLAIEMPGSAALRLPVVLMQQNRRQEAYAELKSVQDNPVYSDEIRREAFRTEIKFNQILRVDDHVQDAAYTRALAFWPEAQALRYQYAMHLFNQKQTESALMQLQAVIKQAPANADALNAYGYTVAKDLGRPKQGFRSIEKAFLLAPEQGEILDSYGYVLHRLGRNQEALPYLQKAMKLTPSAVTAGHLAQVYLQLGDAMQALDSLDKGLQLDRNNAELLALKERML
jgi:tetratricopeptide (TPR) repeat protein